MLLQSVITTKSPSTVATMVRIGGGRIFGPCVGLQSFVTLKLLLTDGALVFHAGLLMSLKKWE